MERGIINPRRERRKRRGETKKNENGIGKKNIVKRCVIDQAHIDLGG